MQTALTLEKGPSSWDFCYSIRLVRLELPNLKLILMILIIHLWTKPMLRDELRYLSEATAMASINRSPGECNFPLI